jgi:hypothetical protein
MEYVDYPIPLLKAQDPFGAVRLNQPIEERHRVIPSGDRFRADGKDVLLFGVNIGPSDLCERGAFQFLASLGINAIRVNLPYREWGPDGNPKRPNRARVELPQPVFDHLCLQQSLCEESGIYVLLRDFGLGLSDPYYSTEDSRALSLPGQPDACVLALWHSGVLELILERVKKLLATENPYTKRPFGASPALLGIQLTNEVAWFLGEPQSERGRIGRALQQASETTLAKLAEALDTSVTSLQRADLGDRLALFAEGSRRSHAEALRVLQQELGTKRPLLIADSAPSAGPAAFRAFDPCDAYGWNLYPDFGDFGTVDGPVKPYDLSPEPNLDRLQARLGRKPTILTETGAKLAPGGYSRLIPDVTVRCLRYGYAGVLFHEMYRPLFGESSRLPRFLESRAPQYNFELSTDPGALCSLQACSVIFRKGAIPRAPRRFRLRGRPDAWMRTAVARGRRLEDLRDICCDLHPPLRNLLGDLDVEIVLDPATQEEVVEDRRSDAGTVDRRHVRCGDVEIEWITDSNPEQDALFLRVPLDGERTLLVVVGRSKPEPAEQRFSNGQARLTGLRKYPWPDPRTGYGTRQVVRRPLGPEVRIRGRLYRVGESGRQGDLVAIVDPTAAHLPTDGIRFMEIAGRGASELCTSSKQSNVL